MRLLPLLFAIALPASVQAEPRRTMIAPDPGCEAPMLLRPAEIRPPEELVLPPSPFRLAMLACPVQGEGPRKRPIRWT